MTMPPEESYYGVFIEEAFRDIYDTDVVYFFTWAPNPAYYPTNTPSDQYKILLDLVFLRSYKVFSSFAFTPELTEAGVVHIHGFYVIKDIVKYYKWFLPLVRNYGFVKVERMKRAHACCNYIMKDCEIMNEILDSSLPIPLTHINIEYYRKQHRLTKKRLKMKLNSRAFARYAKPTTMNIIKKFAEAFDEEKERKEELQILEESYGKKYY